MRSEHPVLLLLIAVLLLGGLGLARHLERERPVEPSVGSSTDPEPRAFRNWLWENRSLDLLVQVALVFAATLGVAAILPNSMETGPPGSTIQSQDQGD